MSRFFIVLALVIAVFFGGCASQRYASREDIENRNLVVSGCLELSTYNPKVDCSKVIEKLGYTKSFYRDSPYNTLAGMSPKPVDDTPLWGKILLALISAKASSHHSSTAYAPSYSPGGQVMGPVTPNAYGPVVGMDATGRAVRTVPY